MSAIDQRAQREAHKSENRQPDYVVRAKTGPGRKEWCTIGSAWTRDNGEGISIKLHAMPIGPHWNGVLKLLPPYAADDASDA
ncbi:hypothetical protein LG047_14105 [Methylocystis sp. WRRC1]|uniref:hypothetical protein n=1 Tax=Methylocystis sp. WRRC1 TaxID=1732014 RepID=UPI001D14B895|nr:hypothetical protein [Methylocystis sp. WRRC1]MCC3246437.1 hypothetical protein [Methylocystis sp. WRRC1]